MPQGVAEAAPSTGLSQNQHPKRCAEWMPMYLVVLELVHAVHEGWVAPRESPQVYCLRGQGGRHRSGGCGDPALLLHPPKLHVYVMGGASSRPGTVLGRGRPQTKPRRLGFELQLCHVAFDPSRPQCPHLENAPIQSSLNSNKRIRVNLYPRSCGMRKADPIAGLRGAGWVKGGAGRLRWITPRQ